MNVKKLIGTSMIALLVVALSVSMAAAMPADVDITDDPIYNPLDGTTTTTTAVLVYDIHYDPVASGGQGDPHTRCITVETAHANLQAKITGGGVDTGFTTGGGPTGMVSDTYLADSAGGVNSDGNYTFTLTVKGTQPGEITVYDNAGTIWTVGAGHDFASATTWAEVPEFAAIAIPVVALLGLVLFMRRKKD